MWLEDYPDGPWEISVGPRDALLLFMGQQVGVITDNSLERRITNLLNFAERQLMDAARAEQATAAVTVTAVDPRRVSHAKHADGSEDWHISADDSDRR